MARQILAIKERVQLIELLREVLVEVSPGEWAFAPGWNDMRVAEKFGLHRVGVAGVKGTRVAIFGKIIKKKTVQPPTNDLGERVAALEAKFVQLTAALGGL
jgi:hypothetical protein